MTRVVFLLSMHRALWGEVTQRLRSVSGSIDESSRRLRIRLIFDGPPSEVDLECASCFVTEVYSDLHDGWEIEEELLAVPAPTPMDHLDEIVFLRHEPAQVDPACK